MRIVLTALTVIALSACSAPAPDPGQSSSALVKDGGLCKVDSDCEPTEKPCGQAVCLNSTCEIASTPKGAPCQGGVGLCDGAGHCEMSDLVCKEYNGPAIGGCETAADCDDGAPCTKDACIDGLCAHAQLADGDVCGPALTCMWGACCVAPYKQCEIVAICSTAPSYTECTVNGNTGDCIGGYCCWG